MLAWNLQNFENSLISIICLAVFVGLAIFVGILFFLISLHKIIFQTLAKSLDLANELKNTPLKTILTRIEIISENSGLFATELRVWRTKYELLLEKKFLSQIKALNDFMEKDKKIAPTIKNKKQIALIYKTLLQLNTTIFELQNEIKSNLELEYILRDRVIEHSKLFAKLHLETQYLDLQESEINRQKIIDTLDRVDSLFDNFFDEVYTGNYNDAVNIISQLSTGGMYLIELLDAIPYILASINTVIPNRLNKIKDETITFSNEEPHRLKNLTRKFNELVNIIDDLRLQLKKQILNLQYKKASAINDDINKKIIMFEQFSKSEEKTKNFFDSRIKEFRKIFDDVNSSIRKISMIFNDNISLKISTPQEVKDFRDIEAKFFKIRNKADQNISSLDFSFDSNTSDISNLKDDFLLILKDTVDILDRLENSAKYAEKLSVNTDKMHDIVVFASSILNQAEVKIGQYKSIEELSKLIPDINNKNRELIKVKQEIVEIRNKEDKMVVETKINELFKQSDELYRQINDMIFKDFISQELIVYIERFTSIYPDLEKSINEINIYFKNRQLDNVITYCMNLLGQIKSNRK